MKILNRTEFINEIYNPMKEQKEYEKLQKINEGILSNLFGKLKNLFKKDWETIKGNESIIKLYKEMDDKLTGFSSMKLSKKEQCNQIRQKLVDFAEMWYEKQMNDAKEDETDPKLVKSMEFKDKLLKDGLDKCKKGIKDIADGDAKMLKWANVLLDDMVVIINRNVYDNLDNPSNETTEKVKELEKEKLKSSEDINKKQEKEQNELLNDVQKSREKYISETGASLMNSSITGDKALENIFSEYKKMSDVIDDDKKLKSAIKHSDYLGLNKTMRKDKSNKFIGSDDLKTSFKIMDEFYKLLNDNDVKKKFETVPAQSIQAMCIALNSFVKNNVCGNPYPDDIELMAKCAIKKNDLIGFNIPFIKDSGDLNLFAQTIDALSKGKMVTKNGSITNLPSDVTISDEFKKTATNMTKKIVSDAKKMMDDFDKKYNNTNE